VTDRPDLLAVPPEALRVITMLESVIRHARDFHDGHFYILSFTTHLKGNFGTPDLDFGTGRDEVSKLPSFESIEELLEYMLAEPSCRCIRLTEGKV
jgi:hypothetical protein